MKTIKDKKILAHDNECLFLHSLRTLEQSKKYNMSSVIAEQLQTDKENVEYLIDLAIFMHDFGKCNPYFQKFKMNNCNDNIEYNEKLTYHSQLSSVYFLEEAYRFSSDHDDEELVMLSIVLTQIIAKHHSNLTDMVSFVREFDDYTEFIRNHKEKNVLLSNFKYHSQFFEEEISLRSFYTDECQHGKYLTIALVLFSLLTTSDVIATKEFNQNYKFEDDVYDDHLKKMLILSYNSSELASFVRNYNKEESETVNDIRSEFILNLDSHMQTISDSDYLFSIEGLVGIGKTHAAQRFAVRMVQKGAERIFWGVPFTSIAAQLNASNKILDTQSVQLDSTQYIREEYSDFSLDYSKMVMNNKLLNYRNSSITFVRYFNLLFSNSKASALQRLSLKNSVIILDEIQSIDNLKFNNFLIQLEKLAKLLNFKVLFMSATIANMKNVKALVDAETFRNKKVLAHRNVLNFDYFKSKQDQLSVLRDINVKGKRVLLQCVTRKRAKEIYEEIKDNYKNVRLYMSDTSLDERNNIVSELKNMSNNEYTCKEMLLITTNAIEAGIDISMNIGIVDLTSIDSLEQLSGRINRNKEYAPNQSIIYIVNNERATFLSSQKVMQTMSMSVEKIEEMFESKNYNKFMNLVYDLSKKDSSFKRQKEWIEQLAFKQISNEMKLIVDDGCFYFHISNDESKELMSLYQNYCELMKGDFKNYDEHYIRKHETIIELEKYKHTILDKEIKQIYLSTIDRDFKIIGGLVFWENTESYEDFYDKKK